MTKDHVNINDDFKTFCRQLEFDLNIDKYKESLIDWKKLDNILILPTQFFWINDFRDHSNPYIHPNVEKITGYSRPDFHDFGFVFSKIHPDERELAYEYSKRTIAACKEFRNELKTNPYFAVFSIDFRFKRADGNYIRLNRQSTCFRTDEDGNMVHALVVFTDITDLKKNGNVSISWSADKNFKFSVDDLIEKYKVNYHITTREKDILAQLAKGESATKIASRLCLSVHTVISHRKNLLEKTGAKNTAELVRLAVEKELF